MNENENGIDRVEGGDAYEKRGLPPNTPPNTLNTIVFKATRTLLFFGFSIAAGMGISEVVSRFYLYVYAYTAGVDIQRLSEDYALGFYGMLIQTGVFLASSIALFVFLIKKAIKGARLNFFHF